MLELLRSVAEAIVAKGFRGLAELVPGGVYFYDVTADAAKRLRDRCRREQVHDELRVAAAASFDEARAAAEQVAREVAAARPVEDRLSLELYLSQVPAAVRKSLRRPDDHTGRTVPPGLAVETPDDLAHLLPPQMPKFRPGQPLPGRGGWTLLEPLGAAGFGEVWKAGHDFIPDVRAVKFCTDPAARQRLLSHEGKLIARVMKECRGPNVVGLVDADLTGDPPWLAYEFVGGGDLAGLILSWQQLPADERVTRATEALRVLAETAGRFHLLTPPIVHRDLKPANILVAADGTLKVTDFGIGGIAAQKLLSGSRDGATAYTRALSLLSGAYTPIYAGPQQQRGDPPDPRDDVHALGVIAYQMLTGRLDTGPGPRFDRDLKELGVSAEVIELVGDCVDPLADHRLSHGHVILDRLRTGSQGAEDAERQQHERWAGEEAEQQARIDAEDEACKEAEAQRQEETEPGARAEAERIAQAAAAEAEAHRWESLRFMSAVTSFVLVPGSILLVPSLVGVFDPAHLAAVAGGVAVSVALGLWLLSITSLALRQWPLARHHMSAVVITSVILSCCGAVAVGITTSFTNPPLALVVGIGVVLIILAARLLLDSLVPDETLNLGVGIVSGLAGATAVAGGVTGFGAWGFGFAETSAATAGVWVVSCLIATVVFVITRR